MTINRKIWIFFALFIGLSVRPAADLRADADAWLAAPPAPVNLKTDLDGAQALYNRTFGLLGAIPANVPRDAAYNGFVTAMNSFEGQLDDLRAEYNNLMSQEEVLNTRRRDLQDRRAIFQANLESAIRKRLAQFGGISVADLGLETAQDLYKNVVDSEEDRQHATQAWRDFVADGRRFIDDEDAYIAAYMACDAAVKKLSDGLQEMQSKILAWLASNNLEPMGNFNPPTGISQQVF